MTIFGHFTDAVLHKTMPYNFYGLIFVVVVVHSLSVVSLNLNFNVRNS